MVRKTPIPLLRNLPPNCPVVRCGLCEELVLHHECCSGPLEAPSCPRRAYLEQSLAIPFEPMKVLMPVIGLRALDA